MNKKPNFYLKVSSDSVEFDKETSPYFAEIKKANKKDYSINFHSKFSRELFHELGYKFLSFIDEYSVEGKIEGRELLENAISNNKHASEMRQEFGDILSVKFSDFDIPKSINLSKVKVLIELLEKYTLDEIRAFKFFPDSTFFRYKALLKKLGWNAKQVSEKTHVVNFDFDDYYMIVNRYFKKLFHFKTSF